MISLETLFWLMIIFFAIIGALRGWTREVIAMSGLVLSLFALNQFGDTLMGFIQIDPNTPITVDMQRQRFYIMAIAHLMIAFFSYQGPTIVGGRIGDRLRVRDSVQDKLLGAIVGAINGYLLVGTLWAFLEMNLAPDGNYPFELTTLIRPGFGSVPPMDIMNNLPLPLLAPYLPILVVVVFLFVIVVMI
ncbi:MAG: hypothetical protein Kow0080_11840 [Candidatus Promineifilaceae bacterium]